MTDIHRPDEFRLNDARFRVYLGDVKVWKRGNGHWRHHSFWGAPTPKQKREALTFARRRADEKEARYGFRPEYPRMRDLSENDGWAEMAGT